MAQADIITERMRLWWKRSGSVGFALLALALYDSRALAQAPVVKPDTVFLDRGFEGGYHAVFIAAADDSIWHQRVAGDIGDVSQNRFVRQQRRMLEELGIRPAPSTGSSHQPLNRVGVKRWNGGYYLYSPSDWSVHRQFQLHAQWLITSETDGPVAHAIVERVPAEPDEAMSFRCVSMISHALDPKRDTVDVVVRQVEGDRGIELWEFTDSYGEVNYELMAPMERARAFPVIVNHSVGMKRKEFNFAEPGPHLLPR